MSMLGLEPSHTSLTDELQFFVDKFKIILTCTSQIKFNLLQ